jgi:hypothetical protein
MPPFLNFGGADVEFPLPAAGLQGLQDETAAAFGIFKPPRDKKSNRNINDNSTTATTIASCIYIDILAVIARSVATKQSRNLRSNPLWIASLRSQ